ncbi:MAG: GGDEF domain-containing protein [Planctomycetes bacterium]|nr:GGDEF domain-containing protein [Planctomycetota bacterium]
MKPHPILIGVAALIAAASLALGGWQLAKSFSVAATPLDLAAPAVAVATALICITVLDWARNLPRRGDRADRMEYDEGATGGVPQAEGRPSAAEQELIEAIHALEEIANGAKSPDAAVEGATRVMAGFAKASEVSLWLTGEGEAFRLRADFAGDAVSLHGHGEPEPAIAEELQEAAECRTPLEATGEDGGRILLPLVDGEGCLGVLRFAIPASQWGEGGDASRRIGAGLAQLAAHFVRTIGAVSEYEQAVLDPVSGAYSERHLRNRLAEAASISRRYGEPLSLVLLGVDQFGMLNNTFGAAAAGRILRALASLIRLNVRDADSVYRRGSDGFAILLPNTEMDRARSAAERLRRIARESRTPADDGQAILITVSGGVAEFDEDMRGIEPLLERAGQALQAAREGGRDRIQVWAEPVAEPPPGV